MKIFCIVVDFVYPPIPIRTFDWTAWEDGHEEFGPYGTGSTQEQAVNDLIEQLEDKYEC